jgi:tetratricopeptide (TPR) repeat protein
MRNTIDVPEERVREVLRRILGSRSFEGVERLKRFLEFVVTETLAGRGDQLKEFAVGEYAFGKGVSFDPRNDPIVRVQARRLRARLERYQQTEGQNDDIFIDLPKGGYVPHFRKHETVVRTRPALTMLLDRNSVVVQPFKYPAGDARVQELCRGIQQDLVHSLTQLEGLTVLVGRDPVDGSGEFGSIAGRTHAAIAVTGSIQRMRDQVRINAQLVDAVTGNYIASELLDRTLDANDFNLQDEVVAMMTHRISEGLLQGMRRPATQTPQSLASHNLYLQARYQMDQRTEDSLRLAATLFEKSIAEDGQFAKAHAGLADAYELMGHYGVIAPLEVWTKAPSSAGMAVLLDDRSAEAHVALAHVRSTQDWDWAAAEHEFRRAIELDPRNASAHHWYAMSCLAPMGRLDEALDSIQVAHALAPLSAIISRDFAGMRYYRREYDLALEQCDQAIELNPYFSQSYWTLGHIQEQRDDYVEALAAFTRAHELAPNSPRNRGALGRLLAVCDKQKQALVILKELKDLSERRYVSPLLFASLSFALQMEDEGYKWLKKAFEDRCFELMLLRVDPRFEPFAADPVFQDLARQLGLPAK